MIWHMTSQNSFEPVALTATNRQLIAAKKTMPANDLRSLVAWLKAHPDRGLLGIASGSTHVNAVLFQKVTGTRFQFVPYRGLAPAVQDLMAGQIDMMITSVADLLPQARNGTIKVYAVAAKSRLAIAPEIPTVDEAGVPGFYTQMWNALWAPARTPKDIIAQTQRRARGGACRSGRAQAARRPWPGNSAARRADA